MDTVLITRLYITKKAEKRYFSVRLPRDAKKIIAVETGVFAKNAFTASEVNYQQENWIRCYRNRVMGLLKIQSTGNANVFYASEVVERERNIGWADFTKEYYPVIKQQGDGRDYEHPLRFWTSEPWIYGCNVAEPVKVDSESNAFMGLYKDEYGKIMDVDIEYTVQVYVWYEV